MWHSGTGMVKSNGAQCVKEIWKKKILLILQKYYINDWKWIKIWLKVTAKNGAQHFKELKKQLWIL